MDAPNITEIKKMFRGVGKNMGEASPVFAWKLMLWTFSLSSLVSIYIAYTAYQWAITPSEIKEVPDRGITVSGEEIKIVVDVYTKRKTEYERLMAGAQVGAPVLYRTETAQGTGGKPISPIPTPPVEEEQPSTLVN